jgi:hypothetical protein
MGGLLDAFVEKFHSHFKDFPLQMGRITLLRNKNILHALMNIAPEKKIKSD